jgi:type IV secretion system protein VirB5
VRVKLLMLIVCCVLLEITPRPALAAMAVIDVSAIRQLVQQVATLREQLATARGQLQQAQSEYAALTGHRGMERLAGGISRNYLPPDWQELERVLGERSVAYGALSRELERVVVERAVLTRDELDDLSADAQRRIAAVRRAAALDQVLAREALANTSQRFASLQSLIDAIATAIDPKAILDLQARVQAEQAMLANEQTKLAVLFQAAAAERLAREQQAREQALRDVGSLRQLPAMGL